MITEKIEKLVKENGKFLIEASLRRLSACKAISAREMQAIADNTELVARLGYHLDGMILQLATFMVKEDLESVTASKIFRTPSNWWQHFKQDCFPKWLVNKFPVKEKEEIVTLTCALSAYLLEDAKRYLELTKREERVVLKFEGVIT